MSLAAPPLISSEKHDWETPEWLFNVLDEEFAFSLDAAASCDTAKCCNYFTPTMDSLGLDWGDYGDTVWLNPPYGRGVEAWIKKAYEESRKGPTVVVLIFSRTDTKWWHSFAMKAAEIRFVKGRLTFLQNGKPAPHPAPAPSCILVFAPWSQGPPSIKTMRKR